MKKRRLLFYKNYFREFYNIQPVKAQRKILWTFKLIEDLDRIPETYFKHLEATDGLYEIRIQVGSNVYRIFCFYDNDNLVVVGNAFQKKSQKTPDNELERAKRIKREYYEEKKTNKPG